MQKIKNWFIDLFKGIGIGISAMIPGVSGGTFAFITKCYDKIVDSIGNIFKNFIKSFLTLLPIAIGCFIGIVAAIIGLDLAFNYILFAIICLFAGLILGSLPSIANEVKNEKIKFSYIIVFIIALLFVLGIALASFLIERGSGYSVSSLFENPKWYLYIIMIPVGAIASMALVAPGISGSMLMLVLGFYNPIVETLTHIFDKETNFWQSFGIVGCFIIGVIVGFYLISKLMSYLLKKHKVVTYYGILGFIIGSIPALFLNNEMLDGKTNGYIGLKNQLWELPVGIILLIVSAIGIYFLLKYIDKRKKENA